MWSRCVVGDVSCGRDVWWVRCDVVKVCGG